MQESMQHKGKGHIATPHKEESSVLGKVSMQHVWHSSVQGLADLTPNTGTLGWTPPQLGLLARWKSTTAHTSVPHTPDNSCCLADVVP